MLSRCVRYDPVLPLYESHGVTVVKLLTDNTRGMRPADPHPFELLLAMEGLGTVDAGAPRQMPAASSSG